MRAAPADRYKAEQVLEDEGWTVVKLPKPEISHTQGIAHIPMLRWCEDNLGPGRIEPSPNNWLDGNDVWYMYSWFGYWTFYFSHAKDATAFTLRWS